MSKRKIHRILVGGRCLGIYQVAGQIARITALISGNGECLGGQTVAPAFLARSVGIDGNAATLRPPATPYTPTATAVLTCVSCRLLAERVVCCIDAVNLISVLRFVFCTSISSAVQPESSITQAMSVGIPMKILFLVIIKNDYLLFYRQIHVR